MIKNTLLMSAAVLATCGVQAALITFEDGNYGVAASDNLAVQDQYQSGAGVTFRTGTGTAYGSYTGSAYLEQMGGDTSGVEGPYPDGTQSGFAYGPDGGGGNQVDTVAAGAGRDGLTAGQRATAMGNYFLRTTSWSKESLVVQYAASVSAASFEVWDIDGSSAGTEKWKITTYNGSWDVADKKFSVSSPEMSGTDDLLSYDGQQYVVELSGAEFDRFVIEFDGTKTYGVGLAFNNFNTTDVPEPTAMALLALGCAAMGLRRRGKAGSGA